MSFDNFQKTAAFERVYKDKFEKRKIQSLFLTLLKKIN